ncbi:MAG: hypothetical protein EA376_00990 [Phycisphaeraceae bacterium]|nr:MAG: hypothetical protein EA376_00990 [Phycisphaeraceae bacterium]
MEGWCAPVRNRLIGAQPLGIAMWMVQKRALSLALACLLLSGGCDRSEPVQLEQFPLVEKALTFQALHQLESPAHERRRSLHEEAERSLGPNALLSDEFFRQAAIYTAQHGDEVIPPGVTREEMVAHSRVMYLLRLFDLLGDERAAPALLKLLYADSNYSIDSFYLLAELAPNDPAIDERIARGVERVLEGPPYPYLSFQPRMLHYQRSELAIENAKKLLDFAESELERIGVPTGENREERRPLYFLRTGVRTALTIAEEYAWADEDDPAVVVQSVFDRRESDRIGLRTANVRTRIYQAMRRRGLVDMFAERAREEIMAEDLGSDNIYRLSSILETLRADIDDELRRKIDDSMAERGRQIRERIRREREAAPDPP